MQTGFDNKRIVVTGVTGFLGSHTAIDLLNKGYRVIGTLRDGTRKESIRSVIAGHTEAIDKFELRVADLEDEAAWPEILKDADAVIHVASPFPTTLPKQDEDLVRPARSGTLNILKAALSQGVKRVVKVSSSGAMIYGKSAGARSGKFSEEDWTDASDLPDTTPYFRSKTLAEKAAWDFVKAHPGEIELVTVCPGAILGPVLESDIGTSANIVYKMLNGSAPAIPPIGFEMVDVRDVAELLRLCLEDTKAAGQRFAAGAGYLSFAEVAGVLRMRYPKHRIPKYMLPKFAVRLFAYIDPTVKPILLDLGEKRELDSSKARTVLGWKPREAHVAVEDCAESIFRLGLVKQK
ncbi:MAG: NAD-dependent epimerase/dehydratase family protein [Flavobacteriales bacterium]|nr:NAD-dependent epimerase/dehydratase family protein [Flavobacteriales bacterium]